MGTSSFLLQLTCDHDYAFWNQALSLRDHLGLTVGSVGLLERIPQGGTQTHQQEPTLPKPRTLTPSLYDAPNTVVDPKPINPNTKK